MNRGRRGWRGRGGGKDDVYSVGREPGGAGRDVSALPFTKLPSYKVSFQRGHRHRLLTVHLNTFKLSKEEPKLPDTLKKRRERPTQTSLKTFHPLCACFFYYFLLHF